MKTRPLRSVSEADGLAAVLRALVREEVDAALDARAGERFSAVPARPAANENTDDVWLTRRQAAERARYSVRTIDRMIRDGKLAAHGRRRDRVRLADLDRALERAGRGSGDGDTTLDEARGRLFEGNGKE